MVVKTSSRFSFQRRWISSGAKFTINMLISWHKHADCIVSHTPWWAEIWFSVYFCNLCSLFLCEMCTASLLKFKISTTWKSENPIAHTHNKRYWLRFRTPSSTKLVDFCDCAYTSSNQVAVVVILEARQIKWRLFELPAKSMQSPSPYKNTLKMCAMGNGGVCINYCARQKK